MILNMIYSIIHLYILGTCLTVTEFNKDSFKVGLSPETLRRTNLGQLKVGHQVNLERALSANTRFGGHFVQVIKSSYLYTYKLTF
jgi:riboflavin synthase alpha subunit